MAPVIEIEGLRKEYRNRKRRSFAVDGLDLEVPEGGVYGFLGPNGSGKTTTIRCLLGLVRPTAGALRLFGKPVPSVLPEAALRIGAIVETPALFPTMSGRQNLLILGRVAGIGRSRVDAVLADVGLAERADDAVAKYSLGMRQRLGLAAALMKDPPLLILDEPANGLDPAGIREIRHLLRKLAAEGRTVFTSSHLLTEIEQTCDRVAILNRGRCVASGTVAEVVASAGESTLVLKAADLAAADGVLRGAGYRVERENGHLRVSATASQAGDLTRTLAAHDMWVTELRPEEHSLEDFFLEVTSEVAT